VFEQTRDPADLARIRYQYRMRIAASAGRRKTFSIAVAAVATVLLLGYPTAALAAVAPDVTTSDVFSTGTTTATVDGTVNPEGLSTTYAVQYGTVDSDWCASGGSSGSPAATTAATDLDSTDDSSNDVTVDLSGLTAGMEYCAQLIATNSDGTGEGGQIDWVQGTPTAVTDDAVSDGGTTATVEGSVDPAGQSTTYKVVYDTAASDWCSSAGATGSPADSTSSVALGSTDPGFHDVSVDLTSLTTGADYCAEIVATNGTSSTPSDDGDQVSWAQGAPSAITFDGSSTGATTATVDGQVDPAGQTTTYKAVYDTADSDWCTSFGTSGDPAGSTTATALATTAAGFHDVSVNVTGLTAGTAYCAEIVASNASGTTSAADGDQTSWTEGLPSVDTFDVASTGTTTATIEGDVNPSGQTTTYNVVYDTADSDWCTSSGASGSPAHNTTATALGSADATFHDISVHLSGLTAGTDYCAEVIATNGSGSTPTDDGDQVFWTQGVPAASTFDAFSTGATKATVEGQVDPVGQTTTYHVVYDTADSDWCSSFGASGSPAHTATDSALGATDNTFHDVSVDLTGLTAGIEYCAEIVATNGTGSTPIDDSGQTTWIEGSPITDTYKVVSTGATTATVQGDVNPAAQSTTYRAQYDVASSEWCTSLGDDGSPAHVTAAVHLGATDTDYHAVTVGLTNLTAGTSYCVELTAANAAGTAEGGVVQWRQITPAVKCIVPKLKGKKLSAAKTAIRKAHCSVGKVTKVKSVNKNKGRVISQSPKAGKHVKKGAKVSLRVGK
jgi:hypothetical protein